MKRKRNGFLCGVRRVATLRREVDEKGLGLRDSSGATQRESLLRLLQYLGPRGLNTLEAVGLGYYRVATRVKELEQSGCVFASKREAVIGADGLYHVGIARYILQNTGSPSPQLPLDLGGA